MRYRLTLILNCGDLRAETERSVLIDSVEEGKAIVQLFADEGVDWMAAGKPFEWLEEEYEHGLGCVTNGPRGIVADIVPEPTS